MAEKKRKTNRTNSNKNTVRGQRQTRKPGTNTREGSRTSRASSSDTVRRNVERQENLLESKAQIRDCIVGIILVALGIFLFVALQTKASGILGDYISRGLKGMFGFIAFFLPYYFIVYGVLLFLRRTIHMSIKSVIYLVIIYLSIDLINAGRFLEFVKEKTVWEGFAKTFNKGIALNGGGVFGMGVGGQLANWIGIAGLYIFSIALLLVFMILLLNNPISRFFEEFKVRKQRRELERAERQRELEEQRQYEHAHTEAQRQPNPVQMEMDLDGMEERRGLTDNQKKILGYMKSEDNLAPSKEEEKKREDKRRTRGSQAEMREELMRETALNDSIIKSVEKEEEHPVETKVPQKMTKKEAAESKLESEDFIGETIDENYEFPPLDLLKQPKRSGNTTNREQLASRAELLEDTLHSFGIEATVTNVIEGPTVTRYEVHPHSGVKVSKIKNLIDDIALNMEAKSIRIEAPIPGKRAVGIEIENAKSKAVTIREIIDSDNFRNSKSKISFALGRDIGGNEIVGDLAAMPHLLIAGSTGSGKSVCINSIITSLLYKARPDEVKMVLIDPKIVELSNYNGIPHLLIPVVTDATKAAAALNWAVAEMDDRYKKFAESGVRDFESYNNIKRKELNSVRDGEVDGPIPQIVIIIDELADLMMVASSQVEESICRLAQKARAAGMHLIVATQRPSVNVITGLIKANIPSRIAFAVTSQVDSRTILDGVGAERLVGKGDMLFAPIGSNKPIRLQGPFISDDEIRDVIEFVKQQAEMEEAAESDVMDTIAKVNTPEAEKGNRDFEDDLLPDAIELVVNAGSASVSMLQRRFRIGYNRAARIIDMMEDRNIVGPPDGSKPRQVLMSQEEFDQLQDDTKDFDKDRKEF